MAAEISLVMLFLFVGHLQHNQVKGSFWRPEGEGNARPYRRSWSSWSPWSFCSRTCGTGIISRTRLCRGRVDENKTQNGFCPGETVEYRICNTQKCPLDSIDFRQWQCSLYNNRQVAQQIVTEWIPYLKGRNECELRCQTKEKDRHYSFGKVMDGTSCSDGQGSICVNGRCSSVGCDGKVGSKALKDICGVCEGGNKTCVFYRKVYVGQPSKPGYHRVAIVPEGASHVEIRDDSQTNQLALTDDRHRYIVNGPGVYSRAARYGALGTYVEYQLLPGNREIIRIPGPTDRNSYVVAFLRGTHPGIYYQYWLSNGGDKGNRSHPYLQPAQPREEKREDSRYHEYEIEDSRPRKWNNVEIIVDREDKGLVLVKVNGTKKNSSRKSGCARCDKVKDPSRNYCQSAFVLRAIVTDVKRAEGKIRYELRVIRSFKSGQPLHHKEYLWTADRCKCPKLRRNKEYVIMARLRRSGRESRLVVDRRSYVRRYNQKRGRLLLKLKEKLNCPK
ncbi:ADAMTS-like protein 5 [Centruroides vittatus]|uniref:ADAMTS-like protein 5 n=1 Tax=Centruroides vittatus TaxID=120091 RepID=UPI0035109DAA